MNIKKIIKIIPALVLLFILNITIVSADTCDDLRPILEKYYEAGKNEDMDAYMSVMDQDYIKENLLDNYSDYVKAAWEIYDTKSYALSPYNCKIEDEQALMYFNIDTVLVSEDEDYPLQRNYVALFHKLDTWKIKYVLDEDIFAQFQSALYTQLFLDASKEDMHDSLDKVDQLLAYDQMVASLTAENLLDTVADGVAPRGKSSKNQDEKSSSLFYLMLLVTIAGGTFAYYKKSLVKKDKE